MLNTRDIEGFDARRREVRAEIAALEQLPPSEETKKRIEALEQELDELDNPDLP